jgi:hypothetical protein
VRTVLRLINGELMIDTFLSTSLVWLGSKLLSRSGEQLYVTDRYSDQDTRPLLEIMADPSMSRLPFCPPYLCKRTDDRSNLLPGTGTIR